MIPGSNWNWDAVTSIVSISWMPLFACRVRDPDAVALTVSTRMATICIKNAS
jgi:hypothetical protein